MFCAQVRAQPQPCSERSVSVDGDQAWGPQLRLHTRFTSLVSVSSESESLPQASHSPSPVQSPDSQVERHRRYIRSASRCLGRHCRYPFPDLGHSFGWYVI